MSAAALAAVIAALPAILGDVESPADQAGIATVAITFGCLCDDDGMLSIRPNAYPPADVLLEVARTVNLHVRPDPPCDVERVRAVLDAILDALPESPQRNRTRSRRAGARSVALDTPRLPC